MDESSQNDWITVLLLLAEWEKGTVHLDELLDKLDPGRSHWLVMDVFRNWLVIDDLLKQQLRRDPRPHTKNLLRLAVCEMRNRGMDRQSQIVHHAVATGKVFGLSRAECGFVNAVLRAMLRNERMFAEIEATVTHPAWLVRRWEDQFGKEATSQLIEWNQKIPRLMIRASGCPGYAKPTKWDGFFELEKGRFQAAMADLGKGTAYVQDPFTRIPVELLAVSPDEQVLDLCAAPGGKTRLLAEAMPGPGRLVAVDKPGPRLKRLQENLELSGFANVRVVGRRLEELDARDMEGLIGRTEADAVLIDVPCSNTGVMQKRPDVKLRLTEKHILQLASVQRHFLDLAARLVRPGGRLVYSTCSIDTDENSGVVESFLQHNPEWEIKESRISLPWECEHDGGAAFLLTRSHTK